MVVHNCRQCGVPCPTARTWYCSPECLRAKRITRDHDRHPTACRECGSEKPRIRGRRLCDECLDKNLPVWERKSADKKAARVRAKRLEDGKRVLAPKIIPEGMRWCAHCQQLLPVKDFNQKSGRGYCTDCTAISNLEYRLKRVYGMTVDEYNQLFQYQDGRCAICLNKPRRRSLAVDHDHKTNIVRGLLCVRCNHQILGAAHDDVDILRRAVKYMEDPPALSYMYTQFQDHLEESA